MRRDEPIVVGRFQEHGTAPYQFRASEDPSYFLRILTNRGERVLWGKDLKRAIAESSTHIKVGDLIGARRSGGDIVTVTTRQRDSQGQPIDRTHPVRRYRWQVEKVQFFAERVKLARRVREDHIEARGALKNRPELISTFLSLRGAEAIAERRIADPKDRERFLALVREAMAKSINHGDPVPAVRLCDVPSPKKEETVPALRPSDPERTR
jgi:hypothetical protein